jgi:hypothetical protein
MCPSNVSEIDLIDHLRSSFSPRINLIKKQCFFPYLLLFLIDIIPGFFYNFPINGFKEIKMLLLLLLYYRCIQISISLMSE